MTKAKSMTRPYIRRNWDDDLITRYHMAKLKSKADYISPENDMGFRYRLFEKIIKYLGSYRYRHIGKRMMRVQQNKHAFLKSDRPRLKNTRPIYGMIL